MKRRKGLTLIELVVVVMILGILVAIAAPKIVGVVGNATDNSARQTLSVVRDAIDRYAAEHGGSYPAADTLSTDLEPYLRGGLPNSPVGTKDNLVTSSNAEPLGSAANGNTGWMYNATTGEIILNCTESLKDGSGLTYNQL